MKLWIKSSGYSEVPKLWYKDGEYTNLHEEEHAEYLVEHSNEMGLDDSWRKNIAKENGLNDLNQLVSYYDEENDELVTPLNDEYAFMQNVLINEALKRGYIRIWNWDDFSIECDDVMKRRSDLKKILTDSYFKKNVFINDYVHNINIDGNSDEVIDALDGKPTDGCVRKYDYDNKKYVYFSTIREALK